MEENLTMDDLKEEIDASFESAPEDIEDPAWQALVQALEDKTVLTVKIEGIVKAGVVTYIEGIRGFIPASRLALGHIEDLEDWLGKKVQVQVITANPEKKKLVLSARELLREQENELRLRKLESIQVGMVVDGKVENIMPYGAFIDLGDGLSGLLHVSQISDKRIKSPDVVLKVGDSVQVKVIAIKDGKVSLSRKALLESSEEEPEEKVELPKAEELTTTLGSLFKNIKL